MFVLEMHSASSEVIEHALGVAQASEFVQTKEGGLDYGIEQNGRNLSGGQKQRMTIARAIAKQAPILILDDSASALDFATDAKLREAIKNQNATSNNLYRVATGSVCAVCRLNSCAR